MKEPIYVSPRYDRYTCIVRAREYRKAHPDAHVTVHESTDYGYSYFEVR